MDHLLSEEQRLIRDMAQKYANDHLAPAAHLVEASENRPLFLENLKGLSVLGFMGVSISEEYGGAGAGALGFSAAITEVAKACASTATTMSVTNMVAEVIQAVGTEDQKQAILPLICSGEYAAGSFCLSESEAGSDPGAMTLKAAKDGDCWVLDGTKLWITSAEYAGVFVTWAKTDPTAPKGKGITCFLVDAKQEGVLIAPPEKKMGQLASSTCAVTFEDCRVPESAVLGELNQGFCIAVGELAGGRIGIASLALGVGLAAMDYAVEYASQRKQFDLPIAQMQGPSWMFADAYTELEAARLLVLNAACLKQQGQPFAKEAAMAKLFASEAANRACYTALQLMGGIGYTKETPLERYARDVRVTSIYEGTSEIQRLIISREILNQLG